MALPPAELIPGSCWGLRLFLFSASNTHGFMEHPCLQCLSHSNRAARQRSHPHSTSPVPLLRHLSSHLNCTEHPQDPTPHLTPPYQPVSCVIRTSSP
ncbi:hypothetical protein FA13DRAFT_1735171 [Coprinellus micaceus]|uniref:Uncharacterized protein n=1 Tax=Coprinellus micaceus TaxID=71717 RepID=A0A4Y7T546_COPMI|nr:hypothetical protein FA13DRAFT_1735171 [Coprinellus micaceus]